MEKNTKSAKQEKVEIPYSIGSYFIGDEKNMMLVSLLGTAQAALATTNPIDAKTADRIAYDISLAMSMVDENPEWAEG
jgi:hypothetical protein